MLDSVPARDFNNCDDKAQFRFKKRAQRRCVEIAHKEGFTIIACVRFCRRHECFHIHINHMALRRIERERGRSRKGECRPSIEREEVLRSSTECVVALLDAGRRNITWLK